LGRPRRVDAKNDVENYQGPATSWENAIRKYRNFPHTFLFKKKNVFSVIMT
jgi:hypothetical protein